MRILKEEKFEKESLIWVVMREKTLEETQREGLRAYLRFENSPCYGKHGTNQDIVWEQRSTGPTAEDSVEDHLIPSRRRLEVQWGHQEFVTIPRTTRAQTRGHPNSINPPPFHGSDVRHRVQGSLKVFVPWYLGCYILYNGGNFKLPINYQIIEQTNQPTPDRAIGPTIVYHFKIIRYSCKQRVMCEFMKSACCQCK